MVKILKGSRDKRYRLFYTIVSAKICLAVGFAVEGVLDSRNCFEEKRHLVAIETGL